MPTGPFRALGTFDVMDHKGNVPQSGPSSKIKVVKSTSKWIKYVRKDARRVNPVVHHARVQYTGQGVWVAHLGGFHTISVKTK